MRKKAIIIDLDNTIYPVASIGDELFASLFELISRDGRHASNLEAIKGDIMRRPFQFVARDFHFDEELTNKGIALLKELTYKGKMASFPDYKVIKTLTLDKFLVTTGFLKLQQSKIAGLKLESDFKEIHIVDPLTSSQTKKDVFGNILYNHRYEPGEVLIIGDDLNSEIKAAKELKIDAVLYDKINQHHAVTGVSKITDFNELFDLL